MARDDVDAGASAIDLVEVDAALSRLLTDSASEFICLHETSGRSIYANTSLLQAFARYPTNFAEFAATPEDAEACHQWWERLLAGHDELLTWRARDRFGVIRWLETRGSIVSYRDRTHVLTVCRDVTSRVQAEAERRGHLWVLKGLDRINRAIQRSGDLEQLMRELLDEVVAIFDADQAGLMYPCETDVASWYVPMIRIRPGNEDLFTGDPVIPRTDDAVRMVMAARSSDGPVRFGPGGDAPLPDVAVPRDTKSLIAMALYPRGERPYLFGMGEQRFAREWTSDEVRLYAEIGHRLEDALTALLKVRRLRESEARLDEAARIAHVGYWEHDLRANRLTWSAETYRILGVTPGPAAPTNEDFIQSVHPDDRARRASVLAQALEGDGRYTVDYRIVRPDGEVRTIHSVGDVTRDASGRPGRAFGVVQDITDLTRAERAATESVSLLNAIVNGTSDSIFVKDRDGRYLLMNEAGARSLGRPPRDVVGRTDDALFEPEVAHAIIERDRDVLASELPQTFEETFSPTGEPRTWVTTKSVYRDGSGKVLGLVGISSDVTELKRLESQFRQAQKMEAVGQLAGGVAHDFNNLLTVINASSSMLLDELGDGDPHRELVTEIREAGDRAAMLTRQLLAFSRKQLLQSRVVDLNVLLGQLLTLLRRLISENIEIVLTRDDSLGLTAIDPTQFEQAVINLAVNARDAMPNGGRLTIETHSVELTADYVEPLSDVQAGSYLLVTVSDTGNGMDEATQARIFEPFFTTKDTGEGTGLGLAMVYGFIKQSGGHVEVTSAPGRGSTFRIYLPRAASAAADRTTPESVERPCGTETVLLVEDDDALRKLAHRILATSGYSVLQADSGEEALRVARAHDGPIHILVTDLMMPGMSGSDLAQVMDRERPALRVLFMSGYAEPELRRPRLSGERVAFLQKPFSPIELARKVREVLDAGEREEQPVG